MNIIFTKNEASEEAIIAHLNLCSKNFMPPLSEKVDIQLYAHKIKQFAVCFEAWEGQILVGLLAAYFNDIEKKTGFITNVSTLTNYSGKGIAKQLIQDCMDYAAILNFETILLEVNRHSLNAIGLYQKFGFHIIDSNHDMLKMNRLL
jgi:ribosomal protein S18 acetylase RimI-like enzyme